MSIDLNAVYPIIDIEDAEYILGVQDGLGIRVNRPPDPPVPPVASGSRIELEYDGALVVDRVVIDTNSEGFYNLGKVCHLKEFFIEEFELDNPDQERSATRDIPEIVFTDYTRLDDEWYGYDIDFSGCGKYSNYSTEGTKLVFGQGLKYLVNDSDTEYSQLLYYTEIDDDGYREIVIPESVVEISGKTFSVTDTTPFVVEDDPETTEALLTNIPRSVKFLGIPSLVSDKCLDFSAFIDDSEGDPLINSIKLYVPWSESGYDRPGYADTLEALFTDVVYEWSPES